MNEISSRDVISIYCQVNDFGISIWIDGGWAVDALLEKQTRPHEDLDIVIEQADLPKLREFLLVLGYRDVERDDTSSWNFVLGDEQGRLIDVHAVVLDEDGNGLYGPIEKGITYPAGSLTGHGVIDGHIVKCISPAHLVGFHTGYELRPQDLHDVALLCERFALALPAEYQDHMHNGSY